MKLLDSLNFDSYNEPKMQYDNNISFSVVFRIDISHSYLHFKYTTIQRTQITTFFLLNCYLLFVIFEVDIFASSIKKTDEAKFQQLFIKI